MSDYEAAIRRLVDSARSTKEQFLEVLEFGRKIGKTDETIYDDVRLAFKALPKSSFYRNLPVELKREYTKSTAAELSTKSNKRNLEIKQNIEAQDVEIIDAKTVTEGTDSIAKATEQIAASIPEHPESETHEPESPHADKPTEEPDDGTENKGDTGNSESLLKKYVDERPMKLKVRMSKKFIGTIFAINQNFAKVLDYDIELTIEGDEVTEVSARPIMRAKVQ